MPTGQPILGRTRNIRNIAHVCSFRSLIVIACINLAGPNPSSISNLPETLCHLQAKPQTFLNSDPQVSRVSSLDSRPAYSRSAALIQFERAKHPLQKPTGPRLFRFVWLRFRLKSRILTRQQAFYQYLQSLNF